MYMDRRRFRGVGRGVSLVSGNPLQVQYITQSYTSDITNDINDQTFEAPGADPGFSERGSEYRGDL